MRGETAQVHILFIFMTYFIVFYSIYKIKCMYVITFKCCRGISGCCQVPDNLPITFIFGKPLITREVKLAIFSFPAINYNLKSKSKLTKSACWNNWKAFARSSFEPCGWQQEMSCFPIYSNFCLQCRTYNDFIANYFFTKSGMWNNFHFRFLLWLKNVAWLL